LDYILVKMRYQNSVKNALTAPGADADIDHNLLIMKTRMTLKKIKRKARRKRWNREVLKSSETSAEFANGVENEISQSLSKQPRQLVITQAWK